MPRGGKRIGAGRKKGHVTERTKRMRAIAERATAEGVTPLDIMLDNARFWHEQAVSADKLEDRAFFRGQSQKAANDAAPYCHPRYATIRYIDDQQTNKITRIVCEIVDPNAMS
jgi:hypothetical protein